MAKKKNTQEVIQVAQQIASVVETPKEGSTRKSEPTQAPKPVKPEPVAAKVKEVKVVEPEPAQVEENLATPRTKPNRTKRIKATASVRGQFHNIRYEIKAGEIYTFPEALANWLIECGRAF